jgi:hypothetical protein
MKSNEEFIAGIYEKAAVYTEEKETKIIKTNWVAKATRIAAMAAVCIGLAGVGILTLDKNGTDSQTGENYGIALTSETDESNGGVAQLRTGPVMASVTFTGEVERIDEEENRIWIKLIFDESAPEHVEGSMVCIKWDVLEKIGEKIAVGNQITATGALSEYVNEASVHNGCAELVLTDMANLIIR